MRGALVDFARRPFRSLKGRGTGAHTKEFWALRDASFEVSQGEVLGVIGANGAGKSTLFKLLSRITHPTEGEFWTQGRVGSLLEVGTGFHPELTGRENMYLNGAILGMRRAEIENRFDEMVEFAELGDFIDTPVKRYSSGMYTRLAFSVAAHLDPEILIVDEVLAVGDARFQRRCLGRMREVASGGRTVLFVSHNMQAVKDLCSRAILLEKGRVKEEGAVDKVIAAYLRQGQMSGGEVEIPADSPRIGSGEGMMRRVSLRDAQDKLLTTLAFTQPFRILLSVEFLKEFREIAIEITISTEDFRKIVNSCNLDAGGRPFSVRAGPRKFCARMDVTLLPGEYYVNVMIQDLERNTTLDMIDNVLAFEVLRVPASGNDAYRWGTVRGHVRPLSRWSTEPS